MLGKILPILIMLVGLGGGVAADIALRPEPEPPDQSDNAPTCEPGTVAADLPAEPVAEGQHDYVKLNNQFVVPVVQDGKVGSLVVLSITLEVAAGQSPSIYEREPKIRDVFLQVLFDHANSGGFAGAFTAATRMTTLRTALREVARQTLGPVVTDVLIIDIVRQDV